MDRLPDGLQDAVHLHEQENEAHIGRGQDQGTGHAEEFTKHEDRPRHRLGDDRQSREVLDLAIQHVGGDEGGQERPADEDRGQAQVDHHPLIVLHGEAGQEIAKDQPNRGHNQHDEQNRLANFRYQRPQHLLSEFAKNGHRVFYFTANLRPLL